MKKTDRVARFYSGPLMKQNIKSNWVLCLAILLVMLLLSNVMNYAGSLMKKEKTAVDVTEYQQEFFTYLGAMATYDTMMNGDLSYDDFISSTDTAKYDTAFAALNAQAGTELSAAGFRSAVDGLSQSGVSIKTYVKEFEYSYALAQKKGVFDKEELTMSGMLNTTLETMGVDPDLIQRMSEMDTSAMINRMYYTVTGLLPIFILIVILANSLIAEKVDRGSMAYVLSTPTKRSAVVITQMLFLLAVPLLLIAVTGGSRIFTTYLFYDEVNVKAQVALFAGMYVLVEAVCAICYLGSCLFSQSRKSVGFGGGLTVWFFLASLLGMFGTDDMVNTGMGVKELGVFNKMTVIGLYDIKALATVGTENVDTSFVWKLCVLAAIAVVCYTAGAVYFTKKDLPL
jgi:ABC-type transport system involved in multi-copper enzyme maturation permease subunit